MQGEWAIEEATTLQEGALVALEAQEDGPTALRTSWVMVTH